MTNTISPMDANHVDVAGMGFAVLDRVYAKHEKPFEALGGSCGNVLVSLAMLQRSVFPLLALGDDAVGNSLVDEFVRAGADTRYISRRYGMSSPVLAQWLDPDAGQHSFSFIYPDTEQDVTRYCSVDELEVDEARPVLSACAVFYTDRLNSSTFRAMQTAAQSGSIVFFEPSAIEDEELFDRAIALSSIVKYSSERLSDRISGLKLRGGAIAVVTHGREGLEVRHGDERAWCAAIKAPVVRDTCGSGDMVSVGIIDWMLTPAKSQFSGTCSDSETDRRRGSFRRDEHLPTEASCFGGIAQLRPEVHQQYSEHVLSDAVDLAPKTVDRVIDSRRLNEPGGAGGEKDLSQIVVLGEFGVQNGAHAVEFDARPGWRDVPLVETMRRHGEQSGRRRGHKPGSHLGSARFADLVRMLCRREGRILEDHWPPKQIAERAVGLLVRAIKSDFGHRRLLECMEDSHGSTMNKYG